MKVIIQTRNGNDFQYQIMPTNTILQLKEKIQDKEGIPISQQQIIFNGEKLNDQHTFNDYNIQEGATIFLSNKEKALLLKSSIIFSESKLVDRIRQSYIDLNLKPPEDEVKFLLNEAISYLDDDLDLKITNELFSLILSCFSVIPDESLIIFDQRINKEIITSNDIIIAASILSFLTVFFPKVSINNYNTFISNALNEILSQMQSSSDNDLNIFSYEIPQYFKKNFIADIILLSEVTEQIVSTFYPYFIKNNIYKLDYFVKKIFEAGLMNFFPESSIIENNLFFCFNDENKINFISKVSEQTFRKILKSIEKDIPSLSPSLSNAIIQKCIELNIQTNSTNLLFNQLTEFNLNSAALDYLVKHNIQLPEKVASKITNYPKNPLILKIIPNPENLPPEFLSYALNQANDFEIYESALKTNKIESPVFKTLEFWNHIISVVSSSCKKCSDSLIKRFSFYLQKNVDVKDINSIIDPLIFDNYPLNKEQSQFLLSLVNCLDHKYNDKLMNYESSKIRNPRLLGQNVIPYPSLCQLFSDDFATDYTKLSPKQLYIFEFSNLRGFSDINKYIKIMGPIKESMHHNLIDFISHNNNYDIISKFDDESLSLIACALTFTSNRIPFDVCGLTIENVLPFYAIAFNHLKYDIKDKYITFFDYKWSLNKSTKEMLDLLLEACKSEESYKNQLFIESINSILSNMDFLLDQESFPLNIAFQMIDIFWASLLNGQKIEKSFLFLILFKLSCEENDPLFQDSTLLIFQKYGMYLLEFILQNADAVIKNTLFNGYLLNLNLFDTNKLAEFLINEIQNSSNDDDDIFKTICFISEYCKYLPELKFNNLTSLNRVIQNKINEEMWDDFIVIIKFMIKNKMETDPSLIKGKQIPFNIREKLIKIEGYNEIEDLVLYMLSDPNLECNQNTMNMMFKLMMKNTSIAIKYITACLEKTVSSFKIFPENLLFKLSHLFDEYKELFVYAINRSYFYSPENRAFIKKLEIQPIEYEELDLSFLSILIENQSYQSFICFQNIASAFPFIFEPDISNVDESHYLLAVDIVLPALDYLPLIYDENGNEEKINQLKTTFAALSFLSSCLYSTRFLSIFVLWLFENITKLNESQVVCMLSLLNSLFQNESINMYILAYAYKYNFHEIAINLLSRDISNKNFSLLYCKTIYCTSYYYFKYLQTVNKFETYENIEEIKNGTINDPFEIEFNSSPTIFSTSIAPIKFLFPNQEAFNNDLADKAFDFVKTINEIKPFWVLNERKNNRYPTRQIVSSFLSLFNDNHYFFIDEPLPKIPRKITIKMLPIIFKQPMWVYQYVFKHEKFQLLAEHYQCLYSFIMELQQIEQSKNDVQIPEKFDSYEKYSNILRNEAFFKYLMNKILEMDECKECDKTICELISIINLNDKNALIFLHYLSDYFKKIESNMQYNIKQFGIIVQIIYDICRNNKNLHKKLIEICGNLFIDISMSSLFRLYDYNLNNAAIIFGLLECEIPIRATQIIGFICNAFPYCIPQAINLYAKIGEEKAVNIFPTIKSAYEKDMKNNNPNYANIKCYLEKVPSLAKKDISFLYNFLNKTIIKYKNENCKNDVIRDIICELFNSLAPERDTYQSIYSPKSNDIDFSLTLSSIDNKNSPSKLFKMNENQNSLLNEAPQSLIQSSSKFWKDVYNKHRLFLSEMIEKDELLFERIKFLHDYHELVPFKLRSSLFRKNIKNRINEQKDLSINVSRSNILVDTFNRLISLKPEDLLCKFHVHFNGEEGVDAGGLTSEWFTYIVKELFNPDFGLFLKSENESYHPNPLSYINQNHIGYFKLAGEIIALALVKGQCVSAHLSIAFLRQILHQKIKLKDLEDYDESLLNSLKMILEMDDVKPLELVFQIDDDQFGQIESINLIENGDTVEVTNENRYEYVSKYANYKLRKAMIKQISAFCDAFEAIIPHKFIKIFSPAELNLMICGVPNIDIEDMKKFTHFYHPYNHKHPVIQMFFNVISKWNQENLAMFLQFLTGSSQVAVSGFKDFVDRGKPITIAPGGEKNRLPVAHTCSNMLSLPEYDDENKMNESLLFAIQNSEFGLI